MPEDKRDFWRRGDKARLAEMVGTTRAHIINIFSRRDRASVDLAKKLEDACNELRIPVRREDLVFNRETTNPFFSGKPVN